MIEREASIGEYQWQKDINSFRESVILPVNEADISVDQISIGVVKRMQRYAAAKLNQRAVKIILGISITPSGIQRDLK